MNAFEYARPASVAEAVELLGASWDDAAVLAGGTDLITCLKQHVMAPKRLVSLRDVPELKGVAEENGRAHIGAMTTLAELAADPLITQHFPALVAAAQGVGSPQIMAAGTVGGDLLQRPRCWYFRTEHGLFAKEGDTALVPAGDNRYHAIFGNDSAAFVCPSSLAPSLVALDATVELSGPGGAVREIPVAELFRVPAAEGEREHSLAANEVLTAILVPLEGLKNGLYEVRHRHGLDWPYVTAAVAYRDSGGAAADARVVLGHVAPVPWRVDAAGEALSGAAISADTAAKAGEAATVGATPLSRNAYKAALVKTAVKRAALTAAGLPLEG